MLFTTRTKSQNAGGYSHWQSNIPTVTLPKILRVMFDNIPKFCANGKSVQNKMENRTNILKSFAGISWDNSRQNLQSHR